MKKPYTALEKIPVLLCKRALYGPVKEPCTALEKSPVFAPADVCGAQLWVAAINGAAPAVVTDLVRQGESDKG